MKGEFSKDLQIVVLATSVTTRSHIRSVLSANGFQNIMPCARVSEAKHLFGEDTPDCLIVEWSIENEADGLHFVRQIRGQPRLFETACVVVTPYVDQDHIVQAAFYDIDDYVAKPFTRKTLEEAVARALRRRKTPSAYTLLLRQAITQMLAKNYEEAYLLFRKAIAERPETSTARFHLGFLEVVHGNFERALTEFNKGIAAQPRDVKCHLGRAFILKKKGDTKNLYQTLKTTVALFPAHATVVNELLPLALERKELPFAADLLKHVVEVRSEFPDLNHTIEMYALTILKRVSTPGNTKFLESLLPNLRSFRVGREKFSAGLVTLLRSVGMTEEAELEARRVQTEFGNSYEMAFEWASSLYAEGSYQKCVEECTVMVQTFGERETTLEIILKCYEKLGNLNKVKQLKSQIDLIRKLAAEKQAKSTKKAG